MTSIYFWSKNVSHSANKKSEAKMAAIRPRVVPRRKEGPPTNTSRNEIRPLFTLVKLAPIHYYIQLNLSVSDMFIYRVYPVKVIELQSAIVPELLGV